MYGTAEVLLHTFLTSELDGSSWLLASCASLLAAGERAPTTHWIGSPRAGFSNCRMPATVQWYMGLERKKKDKKLKRNPDTSHAHAQTLSSCCKNIALFHKMGDNYFLYSCCTQKRWKYCRQLCVTVHKIIIGGKLNVLNHIHWYASCKVWELLP
jgi:hypothetical protein